MSEPLLQLARNGAIATLTLNRPDKRNALGADFADRVSSQSGK